ncbi:MAG: tetratricopeptide repeat protein, partial [Candidatus Stygibacter australis]|nr:tetratricopeptide repeat protein [Candidatus Stygibacter australis]
MNNEGKVKAEFIAWQTFSIFISSTFIDMQAERDHLKNIVFPKVEEELRKNRVRLEVVDLRWGLDTSTINDESDREVRVLQVCLDEIKRCRPFFIGLLGDRYGWVPAEDRMKDAIKRMEEMKGHTRLTTISENREDVPQTPFKKSLFSIFKRNKKEINDNPVSKEPTNTIPSDVSHICKSVTALEIEFGVLASEEQLTRSVFYFRDPLPYKEMPGDVAARYCDEYDPELEDEELSERKVALNNLKVEIRDHFDKKRLKDKVKPYSGNWDKNKHKVVGLEAWGEIVYEDIIRECKAQAKIKESDVPKNVYEQQEALLDAFIEDHTHITTIKTGTTVEEVPTFCGRIELLKELKEHLLNTDAEKWGLVLTGESGSGKSAVFSMIYRMLQREDCVLLANSAGISPRSRNVADLLQRWNKQLSKRLGIKYETDIGKTDEFDLKNISSQQKDQKPAIEELQQKFKELLFAIAEKEQVVILLDALDRFEPTSRAINMTWLPQVMPGKVRMLCTAITGTEVKAVQYHRELVSRDIDHFTKEEAEAMLVMLCLKQHKDMPENVKNSILARNRNDGISACSSPLWLSMAVNILMALDSHDFEEIQKGKGKADQAFNDFMLELVNGYKDTPGELFLDLVDKAAGYFGDEFTLKVFNYLACSRNGLRESDLEKLIPEKNENWDALTFASIRRWFAAHIREEGDNLQWNLAHSILRSSLLNKLEVDEFKNIHNAIAFHLLTLPEIDDIRISETMYFLMKAGNADKALNYYVSCSEQERQGATTVLAEAVSRDEKQHEWCFAILRAAGGNGDEIMKLAHHYIYDLNDALIVEGNLNERQELLDTLHDHIKTKTSISSNKEFGYDFAALNEKLGNIYQSLGKLDQALEFFYKFNHLMKELYESNPSNESLKNGLAISYSKLGDIYQSLGKLDQALKFYDKCNHFMKELYESNPSNESLKNGLAISYANLGEIYQSLGKLDQALEFYNKLNHLFKELYEINPSNESLKNGLASSYSKLGNIYQSLGKMDQALEFYNKFNHLMKELYESNPSNESL